MRRFIILALTGLVLALAVRLAALRDANASWSVGLLLPGTSPPNRWTSLLPGAANRADFAAVGHCLFAPPAGVLGMIAARRFERGPPRKRFGLPMPG